MYCLSVDFIYAFVARPHVKLFWARHWYDSSPCVCPSHCCIVSKWLNMSSKFLHCLVTLMYVVVFL